MDNLEKKENKIIEIKFIGPDNEHYKCCGVFMYNKNGIIRVAFSAKNNNVVDFLDIDKENILKIKEIKSLMDL